MMPKDRGKTPIAEAIEGIEARRRMAPGESGGGEDNAIAEIVRAAAPAFIQAMTKQPAPAPRPPA